LDGGVIASTAEAGRNRLDTGTLGFSDIHNRAEFEGEHQGAGLSSGGSISLIFNKEKEQRRLQEVQLIGDQLGWATRDGSHLNIPLDGRITHK